MERYTRISCALLLFSFLVFSGAQWAGAQARFTLSGYVRDSSSGEELIGATIYVEDLKNGTMSNPYGFYSLTLPQGSYTIRYSSVGYQTQTRQIELKANTSLNIEFEPEAFQMQEVVVMGEAGNEDKNVSDIAMSRNEVSIEMVKKLPSFLGEPDIIKTIQMLPGVVSAGEGTSGFFVRGGSADQNLILIDEAPVYDPSHFFGLFSVFNSDVLKDAELYKGGIPSQFGGRLSSILDVRTKDGNNRHFGGTASIGLLSSKIMLEGPIQKEKSSFLLSGRRSYIDFFQRFAADPDARENLVHFYDLNAKVNWKPSNRDRLFVSGYFGRDVFRFGSDAAFSWGNATATLRWNHLFSERLFSNMTVVFSDFNYQLGIDVPAQEFDWDAGLQEVTVKKDMTWFASPNNEVTYGISAAYRSFSPGRIQPGSPGSIFRTIEFERQHALDYAAYIGNTQKIGTRWAFQYGLRFTLFQNVGAGTINEYQRDQRGLPDNTNIQVLSSRRYGRFEPIKTFANVEPRFSAKYSINSLSSLKASYNRMVQYVHLLTNSTVPVPFNTWTPSSPYLDPQLADQVAGGYFRNFKNNMYEFSAEVYYKDMSRVTDFADNASLLLNADAPTEYRQGRSWSYGLELFLRKTKGRFTGFASYTWSRTERDIPGVNQDIPFLANFDRRHVFNTVATYELDDRWTFGANFSYATGRPFTLPVGRYEFNGYNVSLFSLRNDYRLPDFHRLDLSATYEPRKNKDRKIKTSWNFSIYNAYNRKNPFTIYTRDQQDDEGNVVGDGSQKEARMVYLFPILPSFVYNVRF